MSAALLRVRGDGPMASLHERCEDGAQHPFSDDVGLIDTWILPG